MFYSIISTVFTLALFLTSCGAQYTPCECGQEDRTSTIPILKYPWYAWIDFVDVDRVYYGCLGSLISPKFVVFQPECLGKDSQSKNVMVKFGGNAIISAGDVSELGEIIRYNNENKEIALVKLNQELNCKRQVQPICIELENDVPTDRNQQIIVCGLSSNNYRYEWPYMVAVNTSFVNKKQCATQLGVTRSSLEKNICVSHNDYCMHDVVGGALTQEYKNKTHIIGIKYSDLCNHGKPTVHIDINKYRHWIREQISKK